MKKLLTVLLFMSLLVSVSSAEDAVPGDVIVVLRNDSGVRIQSAVSSGGIKSLSTVKSFTASHNVRVLETFDSLSEAGNYIFMTIHSDTEDENTLLRKVRNNPNVVAASLNRIYRLDLPQVPNDSDYYRLWGMEAINAPNAWSFGTGSEDVYVAVIDTGIDYNHPDLKDNFSREYSRNFVAHTSNSYDPSAYYDERGHGTHVAGTIAGVGNNALGVAGVNWKAKLISLRVFGPVGSASDADIIAALNYLAGLLAKDSRLNIAAVNLSLGGYVPSMPEETIAQNDPTWLVFKVLSDTNRIILSVSAGNEDNYNGAPTFSPSYRDGRIRWYKGSYAYPACYIGIDNMITVAAADQNLVKADFSNYSKKYVDIAAPGVDIYSTLPTTVSQDQNYSVTTTVYPYGLMSGTSMAAPHVTGSAVLLKSIFPKATASQIKAAILGGANGDYLRDDEIGTSAHGLLDLKGAINFLTAVMSQDTAPEISDTVLPTGGLKQRYKAELYASGTQPLTWSIDGELPEGITFKDGKITGTPQEAGSFPFTVTASNDYGSSSLVLTLSIDNAVAPVLDKSTVSYDTFVGVNECLATMLTTSGTWPMVWSIGSGDVPADFGLSIVAESGILRFTPRSAGTFKIPVKVSNDAGNDSAEFTLRVREADVPEILYSSDKPLTPAVLGRRYMRYAFYTADSAYGRILQNTVTAKGTRPMSWDVQNLPDGMTFSVSNPDNDSTASVVTIAGRPNVSGDFTLTFIASNTAGTSSRDIPFTVEEVKPKILDNERIIYTIFTNGLEVNTDFSAPIPVEGSAPITFTISGDLPEGTHMRYDDSTPTFYGKPTKTGHYIFGLTAENSRGKDERLYDFYVYEPSAVITRILPDAVVGVSYDAKISLRSDVPMSWSLSADRELNLRISNSGEITGRPGKEGHFTITVTAASKDIKVSKSAVCNLIVRALPAIKTASLSDGKVNTAYTPTTLSADGTSPVVWSVSEGRMPAGLTLSQNGYIYGTPTESGVFLFTLKAQNKAGHDTRTFTVNITGGSTPEKQESPDVPVTPESPDVPPVPTSPDKPVTPPVKIIEGSARGIESLTIGELASIANADGVIAAILPEISTNLEGFYTPDSIDCFANIKISDDVPTGWTLVWNAFTRGKANALSVEDAEDDNVQFTDSDGGIIITVPENHIVNVSAWLDADTLYAPVISAVEHKEAAEGVASSSSGGCNAGMLSLALFVPIIAVILRKR